MTDIRMKEFGGMRRAKKVIFIDREKDVMIEGSFKSVYKECHNQKVDHSCITMENGELVEMFIGSLDERTF